MVGGGWKVGGVGGYGWSTCVKPSMLARASRGRTDHDAKWPVNIPSGFFTVAKPALPDACSQAARRT